MICPACKNEIERDSFYCDQCGEEILICPACKNPGKGKRCTQDGSKLIPAKAFNPNVQTDATQTSAGQTTMGATGTAQTQYQQHFVGTNIPVPQVGQPATPLTPKTNTGQQGDVWPEYAGDNSNAQASAGDCVTFTNNTLAIKIDLKNGDIIGRKTGNFTHVFGKLNQISGKHAQITQDPLRGFMITDLNSSNGVKVNGIRIPPNQPTQLTNNCRVVLANVEFIIQIAAPPDSDATVRV